MVYPELNSVNTSQGLQTLFVYVNDITNGLFSRMFLTSLFVIIMVGSYFSRERMSGKGDWISSFAVAGYITFGAAIIMSFIPGMIDNLSIVICLAIAFIGTLWLLLSKDSSY